MDYTEAESRYKDLKIQRDTGQISPAEFTSRIHELRLQDIGGIWWQISEQDGRWLRWNGLAWEPAEPGAVATPPPVTYSPNIPVTPIKSQVIARDPGNKWIFLIIGILCITAVFFVFFYSGQSYGIGYNFNKNTVIPATPESGVSTQVAGSPGSLLRTTMSPAGTAVILPPVGSSSQNANIITIKENTGSFLNDYQIRVLLDSTNFDFTKAKPDGSDLRFSGTDGKDLYFWIEEWNLNKRKAKIWVKVPFIPASGTTSIFMQTGTSNPSDLNSGDGTFVFFDDFSGNSLDSDKWGVYSQGTDARVEVSGGTCKIMSPMPLSGAAIMSKAFFNINTAFVVKRAKFTTGPDFRGPMQRQGFVDGSYYNDPQAKNKIDHGTEFSSESWVRWVTVSNGQVYSPYKDWADVGIPGGTYYLSDVAWSYEGLANRSVSWFLNDQHITSMDYTSNTDVPMSQMHVFLSSSPYSGGDQNTGYMAVDYAYVRKYVEPEPSVTLSPAITQPGITGIPTADYQIVSGISPIKTTTRTSSSPVQPIYRPVAAVATGFGIALLAAKFSRETLSQLTEKIIAFFKNYLGIEIVGLMGKTEMEKRGIGPSEHGDRVLLGLSAREWGVVSITTLSFAFAFILTDQLKFDILTIAVFVCAAGIATILHDIAHKLRADHYGCTSEYQFWGLGLVTMFLTSWLFGIVFAKPSRTLIECHGYNSERESAMIMIAGPLVSLVIAGIFYLMIPLGGIFALFGSAGFAINMLSCVYALFPVTPMDGKKIYEWNKLVWGILFFPLIILYFFVLMA